jgi:hypothetical protein
MVRSSGPGRERSRTHRRRRSAQPAYRLRARLVNCRSGARSARRILGSSTRSWPACVHPFSRFHSTSRCSSAWPRHSPPSEHRQAGRCSAPARGHLTLGARTGALNSRRDARFAFLQWRRSVRAAEPARRLMIVSATSSPFGDSILPKRPLAYESLPSGGPQALLAYVFPEMMA